MQGWQAAQAADGDNVIPSHLPSGIDDFVELVVPEQWPVSVAPQRPIAAFAGALGYGPVVGMIVAANAKLLRIEGVHHDDFRASRRYP